MYKYNDLSEAINCINCIYRDLWPLCWIASSRGFICSCGPARHWINCGY